MLGGRIHNLQKELLGSKLVLVELDLVVGIPEI
jgi:hypothetical protein